MFEVPKVGGILKGKCARFDGIWLKIRNEWTEDNKLITCLMK
jgi:hypothetical protein